MHHLYVGHGGQFHIYSETLVYVLLSNMSTIVLPMQQYRTSVYNSFIGRFRQIMYGQDLDVGYRTITLGRILGRYHCHISSSTFKYILKCVRFYFVGCICFLISIRRKCNAVCVTGLKYFLRGYSWTTFLTTHSNTFIGHDNCT